MKQAKPLSPKFSPLVNCPPLLRRQILALKGGLASMWQPRQSQLRWGIYYWMPDGKGWRVFSLANNRRLAEEGAEKLRTGQMEIHPPAVEVREWYE